MGENKRHTETHTEATTEVAAEWVLTSALKPWANNPRKNDGEPVRKVAESIKRFGFGAPILARKANGEIIAGHTRWKAAQQLGLERVPVRYLDLDPADAKLLAIADNRVGEEAEWDDASLERILSALRDEGADLSLTGFDEDELIELLNTEETIGSGADESDALSRPDELQSKWKTSLGQVWEIPSRACPGKSHRIVCGDSTSPESVAALMGDDRACMMWTDPPYGVGYVGKTKDGLEIQNDKLDPDALRALLLASFRSAPLEAGAACYVAHPAGPLSMAFMSAFSEVFSFRQSLVWVKDSMVLGRSDYHYKHEPIMFGYKPATGKGRLGRGGSNWFGDNAQVSIFDVARPKTSAEHPTMKPIELVEKMVRNSSPAGGTVYEPFSGSGTTMLACESSARICRSIELDPRFVAVALERFEELGLHGKLSEAR